jgi:hypothetical protein
MTRRYGASGIVGLGTIPWLTPGRPGPAATVGGMAGWFFVQGAVSISAIVGGAVSGATWITVLTDPSLGARSLVLLRRLD